MTREHNWADNYTFAAARIHRPVSVDEVRRIVVRSSRVRAIGARHCFNGIADSPGDLIDLGGIEPNFVIDPERRAVTVGAGANYSVLTSHLHQAGWALHNMASLPHVSIAGAAATGTHGSGDRLGNLSSAVAELELVSATGDLVTIRRGDPGFDGAVVALGALGVVTRVTLDIQPEFEMRQDAFEGLPWSTVLNDFDAVMSAGYSVSLMTSWSEPTVTRLWIKTQLTGDARDAAPVAHLGALPASHPLARSTPEAMAQLNPFGAPGPWSERLPHFRSDAQPGPPGHLQSEYVVPRAQATAAISKVHAIGDRIDPHLWVTEIRSMAGDPLWLSPAYGYDSVGIHFSWLREPDIVQALTEEIEAMLLPLGARPHWGKIIHAAAPQLMLLYPKFPAFRDLARSYDPAGKFRNRFLDTHIFGSQGTGD
jgi:xylitol oxidase